MTVVRHLYGLGGVVLGAMFLACSRPIAAFYAKLFHDRGSVRFERAYSSRRGLWWVRFAGVWFLGFGIYWMVVGTG